MPAISITAAGRLLRSLNQSSESLPPARNQAPLPKRCASATASATVLGWYSSKCGITSRCIMVAVLVGIHLKRAVGGRTLQDGVQNHVHLDRRAVEDMAPEGIGDGAEHGGCRGPQGRLADALGAHGTCLLYTSDAADDLLCVDLGGRR